MGVVNVTPDSFSDGGAWFTPEAAVAHGRELVAQGADLLDVGGESTRPGAERAERREELRRVLPVVEALRAAGAGRRSTRCAPRSPPPRWRPAPPSSTTSAAGWPTPRWPRSSPSAAVPFVAMHWRGHSRDMQTGRATTTSSPTWSRELRERVEALAARRRRPGRRRARPRLRVRQERRAQLGAAAPARRGRGARPPGPRRHLAQDASSGACGRTAGRAPGRRSSATSPPRPRPCTPPGTASGACGCTTSPATVDAARRRRAPCSGRPRERHAVSGVSRDRIRLIGCSRSRFPRRLRPRAPRGPGVRRRRRAAVDLAPAGASDDLADTVHYGEIGAAVLARIAGEPLDLIERLAELHRRRTPSSTAAVDEVDVTVHKPQAPVGVPFGDVTVTVTPARDPGARGRRRRREPAARRAAARRTSPAAAVDALAQHAGLTVVSSSGLYDTEPVGGPEQPDLPQRRRHGPHHAVAPVAAARAARHRGGVRPPVREVRWGPRTLDLDLIQYGDPASDTDVTSDLPRLTLPHPRAHERAFVLVPWLEADPERRAARRGPGGAGRRPRRRRSTPAGVRRHRRPTPHPTEGHETDAAQRIRVQTLVLVAAVDRHHRRSPSSRSSPASGSLVPRPPCCSGVLLVAMGGLVLWLARPVRRYLHGRATTPLDPLRAARTVVLAQAAALTGSAAAGWYAGQLAVVAERPLARREPGPAAAAGALVVAGVALAAAGLVAQRWCRVDPPDEDDDEPRPGCDGRRSAATRQRLRSVPKATSVPDARVAATCRRRRRRRTSSPARPPCRPPGSPGSTSRAPARC